MGPRFEEAFAARLGAAYASAVSSGTAGLHLALRAAGVRDGDEVVTSPFSFVASANAIVFERARPVFADIDPRTLNLDPAAAAAAVTEHTTALLPGHILGFPPPGRRGGPPPPTTRPRSGGCTSAPPPPPCRPSSASACRSSRTPVRPWAPSTPTARPSAPAAIRPSSASTPTSS